MARARNIKPGFFINEDLTELPFEYRLLFIGLWTLADREGKLEDRPKRIKMELFPADNVDVDQGLSELERYGFLERYEVNGLRVVMILKFTEHQRPHHTEKASELPNKDGSFPEQSRKKVAAPTEVDDSVNGEVTVKGALLDGGNPPDSLNPDSLIPDTGLSDSQIPEQPAAETASVPVPEPKPKVSKQKGKPRPPAKTPLPDDFEISDSVRAWAEREGHLPDLQAHFDNFVGVALAKGYTYANWDQALMNAIRQNWAKVGERTIGRALPNKSFAQQRTEAEIAAFVGDADDNVIEMEVRRVGF